MGGAETARSLSPVKPSMIIKCPCCGVEIDIDVATGKIVRHGPKLGGAPAPERFDDALKSIRSRDKQIASAFDKAQDNLRGRDRKLDAAFRDAFKKVQETDDGSKPWNPLDAD